MTRGYLPDRWLHGCSRMTACRRQGRAPQRPDTARCPADRRPWNPSASRSPRPNRGSGVWGLGSGVWGLGSGVWGLGSGVWGLGSGVWGLGSGVWGLGSGVWGLGSGVWGLGSGVWGLGSGAIWMPRRWVSRVSMGDSPESIESKSQGLPLPGPQVGNA